MFIICVSLKAHFFSRNTYEYTLVHSYISFRSYIKYFYVWFKAEVETGDEGWVSRNGTGNRIMGLYVTQYLSRSRTFLSKDLIKSCSS